MTDLIELLQAVLAQGVIVEEVRARGTLGNARGSAWRVRLDIPEALLSDDIETEDSREPAERPQYPGRW